jgi:uncharacterized protein
MKASRDWAVVTGASSGIGRAFAEEFAKDGTNLVLAGRDGLALGAEATRLEKKYGIKTLMYAGDLAERTAMEELMTTVEEARLRVVYLVNSAGSGQYGAFDKTDWTKEMAMIAVNMTATSYLCKRFITLFKEQGRGRIVNLASMAAFFPGPNMAVYHATKAYVLSLSLALSEELSGSGVTVTALCPGPTDTGFARSAGAGGSSLFSRPLPTAESVAAAGYASMMKGRPLAVIGTRNKAIAWLSRFVPRHRQAAFMARAHL